MASSLLFVYVPDLVYVGAGLSYISRPRFVPRCMSSEAPQSSPSSSPPSPSRRTRKPKGYWLDMTNLRAELDAYTAAAGLPPGVMPTAATLREAKRRDLDNAITKAGGYRVVAREIGFSAVSQERKPHGYWNLFSNVAIEIREFGQIYLSGDVGRMPTLAELRAARRIDLQQGIERHGGFIAVAERLGLRRVSKCKPAGYWKAWDLVSSEMRTFVAERDQFHVLHAEHTLMPSQAQLRKGGRADLAEAINDFHGGFSAVANRLGYKSRQKNWSEFHTLAREIYVFIREQNDSLPIMPTTSMLKLRNRPDLRGAISKHGGMVVVSERLGLQYSVRIRDVFRKWDVFRYSLLAFTREHGCQGRLPSFHELRKFDRTDLCHAILWHGGPREVSVKTGLRASNFWQEFHFVGMLLFDFVDKHGSPGVMPTNREFEEVGQRTLHVAVEKFGYSNVATRLGLKEPPQMRHVQKDDCSPKEAASDDGGLESESDLVDDSGNDIDDIVVAASLSVDDLGLTDTS